MSFLLRGTARLAPLTNTTTRAFTTSRILSIKVDADFISRITAAEKALTNSDDPVRGGPTSKAQAHVGQELTSQVIHDITAGEKVITQSDLPVSGGPTSIAQSILSGSSAISNNNATTTGGGNASTVSAAGTSGVVDSTTLHNITEAEKQITGKDGPVRGGPTAQAQKHVREPISDAVLDDIRKGEEKIASNGANATSTTANNTSTTASSSSIPNRAGTAQQQQQQHTGHLDSSTLSNITDAEKKITGADGPVPGGPTARAQQHANEPITSQALHDITEGEKKVTGGERVKGGPTSTAQSELGKSRNN